VVVFILGAKYGTLQPSGLSATEEEYNEARATRPVLVFVQNGIQPEERQEAFLGRVKLWNAGHLTAHFDGSPDLRRAVVQALRDLEVSKSSAPSDPRNAIEAAKARIESLAVTGGPTLVLATAGSTQRSVIRPAELAAKSFAERVLQRAVYGEARVLSPTAESRITQIESALLIQQGRASVLVDEKATIAVQAAATEERPRGSGGIPVMIEDHVRELLLNGIRFTAGLLDSIDPSRRISWVVQVVSIREPGMWPWRTREEQRQNPNSFAFTMDRSPVTTTLADPNLPRAELKFSAERLADDFTVLLRRELVR
jgi:hypothetical protein